MSTQKKDVRRWEKVESLFYEALDIAPADRASFLDKACPRDDSIRQDVERLLALDADADSVLDESPVDAHSLAELSDTAGSLASVDSHIGPYRLVQVIGEGGMGTVWLAERADEHFEKRVAIKLLRHGMDGDESLKRFRVERQVLADLQHPNIAHLIDGGVTCQGLPYLVMEHVKGQRIDQYCDQRALSIKARLELFCDVCKGVEYAHSSLVVHRDLKPQNVFVTEDGFVKLLDFGIAKVLAPSGVEDTVDVTQAGRHLMTPRYASPEQVLGHPITTASDTYALGVVLYELLTGRRPYELDTTSAAQLERIVCEHEPTRPSMAVDQAVDETTAASSEHSPTTAESVSHARGVDCATLRKQLTGDLDTIVLMALRKEPDRRYSSVEQFSQDIRRFLDDLPVTARPDTFPYRSQKFVRRNRWAVGVASAFVFSLVTGLVVTTGLYRDAALARTAERVARENAESRAAEAEQTAAFFADMLGSVSPGFAQGRDMTVIREVLDRASDQVATKLAEFPQAEATLRMTIGNTYGLLGDYERATPHLEAALALNVRLHGEDSLEVAEVFQKQAVLAEALGDYDGARELFTRQLPIREREGDHIGIAEVWSGQARLAYIAGDPAEMLEKAERARDVFLNELSEIDERTIKAMDLIAGAHTLFGRYEEAVDGFTKLNELWTTLKGPMHPATITNEANLAMLLRHLKRNEEAEERLTRVVDTAAQVFGEEHENTLGARTSLAQTLQALKRFDEAEVQVRIAFETLGRTVGERHPDTLHASSVLGSVLLGARRFDESIKVLRKSYELHVEVMSKDSPGANATATALGTALLEAGRRHWSEAEAVLTDAVERLVKLGGPKFQLTKNAVKQLRRLYSPDAQDRPDKLAELGQRFGSD
jgi:serine/threonine protein kinase/tetratricopeptide (TPR) repeat protein